MMPSILFLPRGTLPIILLAGLILPQAALTLWFVWIMRSRMRSFCRRNQLRATSADIPAEVVLCLRGCDPTLEDVLASLARQSHRRWRLCIVVDSVSDPAWEVAHAAIQRLTATSSPSWSGVTVEPLNERPARGSLKCASLRQALSALAMDTQAVALIDADSVVHADWLVTMVDECMQPGVGAVSGNRWYDPARDSPAGVVRAIWNAGAIVQMTVFGIPWGGSLAVRREAMNDCKWVEAIEASLCEDTVLAAPLALSGWAYRFVPALIAVDRDDDIALGPLGRWIARQLLTVRLHHRAWPLVAVHGLSTSIVLVATLVGTVVSGLAGARPTAATWLGFLAIYEAANLGLLLVIAAAVRAALAQTGKHVRPLDPARTAWWAALIPATQAVYASAISAATWARIVEWRGITYVWTNSRTGREVRMASTHAIEAMQTQPMS